MIRLITGEWKRDDIDCWLDSVQFSAGWSDAEDEEGKRQKYILKASLKRRWKVKEGTMER